jgi:hypothetical protein
MVIVALDMVYVLCAAQGERRASCEGLCNRGLKISLATDRTFACLRQRFSLGLHNAHRAAAFRRFAVEYVS